jgi:predicted outer membrane repeat protein
VERMQKAGIDASVGESKGGAIATTNVTVS